MTTWIEWGMAGLLGLLVGSFLNVVIVRLPRMIEREWQSDPTEGPVFNLARPASHCTVCLKIGRAHV